MGREVPARDPGALPRTPSNQPFTLCPDGYQGFAPGDQCPLCKPGGAESPAPDPQAGQVPHSLWHRALYMDHRDPSGLRVSPHPRSLAVECCSDQAQGQEQG